LHSWPAVGHFEPFDGADEGQAAPPPSPEPLELPELLLAEPSGVFMTKTVELSEQAATTAAARSGEQTNNARRGALDMGCHPHEQLPCRCEGCGKVAAEALFLGKSLRPAVSGVRCGESL
jgi:hypothetical protein